MKGFFLCLAGSQLRQSFIARQIIPLQNHQRCSTSIQSLINNPSDQHNHVNLAPAQCQAVKMIQNCHQGQNIFVLNMTS